MPPVKSISLSDGIEIITSGNLYNFFQTASEIEGRLAGVSGNLRKKEAKFNEWLNSQSPFQIRRPLSNFSPDDPIILGTSIGGEIIDNDEVIIQCFHIAVHILQSNPLKITVMTSNSQIGGDWWL